MYTLCYAAIIISIINYLIIYEIKCHNSTDNVLQCECCILWFCNTCCNIPGDVFCKIGEIKTLHWFCSTCDSLVMDLLNKSTGTGFISSTIDTAIHKSLDEAMDQFIKVLTDTTTQLQQSLSKFPVSNEESMDTTHTSPILTQTTSTASHTVTDVVDEYIDRERRKKNLIIYGLPELECTIEEQRRVSDKQQVSNLFSSEFDVSPDLIQKFIRLGIPKPDKPRLLRVELGDFTTKKNVLRQATKLHTRTTWKKVYISPDLTPKE